MVVLLLSAAGHLWCRTGEWGDVTEVAEHQVVLVAFLSYTLVLGSVTVVPMMQRQGQIQREGMPP